MVPHSTRVQKGANLLQEVHTERNIMVAMRDGFRLATDVYRPAEAGKPLAGVFPVLLQRTPYSKTREDFVLEAAFFASHGYATVLQDCRGRYESEGGFTKYIVHHGRRIRE
jgi:putative CocE/NonD family hydrolase